MSATNRIETLYILVNTMLYGVLSIEERFYMPDHVHMLAEVDPQLGIHRFVKKVKGVSSRILRDEFLSLKSRIPTLWTNSYFVTTVGGAPLEVIKQYVENQKSV